MAAGRENWGSRIGVILAVAGSAVGLGNFLRFPGLAAANGGGAFMIPYFVSFLLLGIPICWMEWSLGRYGGGFGFNSAPGIFYRISGRKGAAFLGLLCIVVPVVIFMYYICIETWCLAYAFHYLTGGLSLGKEAAAYGAFFEKFTGMSGNGALFGSGGGMMLPLLLLCFVLNFILIYRGLSKGIETFCKVALPLLIVCAVIVLVRVLTLGTPDAAFPERNVNNALGFMWNPRFEVLTQGKVWLAASGQIFFTLSLGMGVILNYASYLRKKDDVVLSSLTASSTNEFCEVILGGLITIPAAFLFLGAEPVAKVSGSTLGLGFYTIPVVFSHMAAGQFFGFLWFFLLFLAAITSSISMLQPAIAFIEEGFGVGRRTSVAGLGFVTALGAFAVVYLSKNLAALDTMDFWVGTAGVYVMAMIQVFYYGWVLGVKKGLAEASTGASFPIPRIMGFVMKYVTPAYLVAVFGLWLWNSAGGYVRAAMQNPDVKVTLLGLGAFTLFTALLISRAVRKWAHHAGKQGSGV